MPFYASFDEPMRAISFTPASSTCACPICTGVQAPAAPARIAGAVIGAAATLDQYYPGWEDKMDTEILDINDSYACVLGQLFYEEGNKRCYSGYEYAQNQPFWYELDESQEAFYNSCATEYWIEQIEIRRAAKAVTAKSDHALVA